jgi:hypothetical protein
MPAKQRRSKPEGGDAGEPVPPQQSSGERRPGDVYRDDAVVLQQAAGAVATVLAELEAPLTTGDLKEFPRPPGDVRAAIAGVEYLRESFERAGAMLYAIGAMRDQREEVDPLMLAAVKPFTDALRLLRQQHGEAGSGA